MTLPIAGEYESVVHEKLKRAKEDPLYVRATWNIKDARRLAREIISHLEGYDANTANIHESIPEIVIVRVGKFIIYIIPLPPRIILTGIRSLRIVEKILPLLEKISDHGFKPTLIFFSRKGILTLAAYLFLGTLIEKYGIGILFVNGSIDEILEILWSLENKGGFTPEEEESVEI